MTNQDYDLFKQVEFLRQYSQGVFKVDQGQIIRCKKFVARKNKSPRLVEIPNRRAERVFGEYLAVRTSADGQRITIMAQRFIWSTVNGIIPFGMEIDHIDGNKRNNCIDNLRLVTPKENVRSAWENGLCETPKGRFYKITNQDVSRMEELDNSGYSKRKIAKEIGCAVGTVTAHLKRSQMEKSNA